MAIPQPMRGPVAGLWRSCLIRLFGGLALLGASFLTQAANYSLAVVPQASPAETYRRWAPFVEQLQRATGQHLQLRVYRTFDEFETDLVNGRVDFAYMNPYHFLMARKAQGYLPLVRDGSRLLSGQLLVRRDSPVQSVKDLDGKTIGFPDPNAFAASLYMRSLLQEKAKIRFTPNYFGTHGNVYRHVVLGDVAAGAGVNVTFARERAEIRDQLRVLYETPGTAPHPLCAHPRIPTDLREAVTRAVLELGKNDNGRALLKRIDILQPVRASYARDYRSLDKLDLKKYTVPTELSQR
jgi:phosphonate transport system substrate-binding protein